jgi:hypothetical protein
MSLGYDGPRDLLPFALRISSGTQMTGRSDDVRQRYEGGGDDGVTFPRIAWSAAIRR